MAMDTTGTFPYDFLKVVGVSSSYRASEQGDVGCVVRRVASSHPLHIQIDS